MNEEFNFNPSSIEKFGNNLEEKYKENEKQFYKIRNNLEEKYKENEKQSDSILIIGRPRFGKSTLLTSLLSQKNPTIPDLPNFNSIADSDEKKPNLQRLLQAQSEIRNLKKETQKIDEKINAFFELLKKRDKALQKYPMIVLLACPSIDKDFELFFEEHCQSTILLSEILEIQEKNRKLLACITKLEATLQAVMLMWLVVSVKQIPSFIVYLICSLNMNVVEWLRSGLGEEMMGDLTERHDEIKKEHPNSNVLVSFILLGTAFQMLWSVLLIKLDDLLSDEEIKLYSIDMPLSFA